MSYRDGVGMDGEMFFIWVVMIYIFYLKVFKLKKLVGMVYMRENYY